MATKNRLELNWIGKDRRPRLEPRILLEEEAYSYHANTRKDGDIFDNVLIKGDNLLALKALEQKYAGRVKCVFIDPPYNTGSAFEHYDDGVEHSVWLGLMRDRLEILHSLLADDGSLWITIDDNEAHYLKVMCDEIFGRANFVANALWQKKFAGKADSGFFSEFHDHILVYAKSKPNLRLNGMPRSETQDARYKNPDNDLRGVWASDNLLRTEFRDYAYYPVETPSGKLYYPPKGSSWRFTKERLQELREDNRIWFGEAGGNMPRLKRFLHEVAQSLPPTTWWTHAEVGHNSEAKKELMSLLSEVDDIFATPKPERLIQRVLHIATNAGDLVLDSFAGSGTTGAVAHKMGRHWIMVELGNHCETHIVPRMNKVIDGEQGGVSQAVGWKGGGGYRYFKLAPSLLEKDGFDQWVISKSYNAEMLSEAMCKHFGFVYAPTGEAYWQQGYSSETDFIYVTTMAMSFEQRKSLSDEVGPDRSLVVCCKAFEGGHADAFANLTLRKIPNAILDQCEWGHDDYSLKIANLPIAEDEDLGFDEEPDPSPKPTRKVKAPDTGTGELFGDESEG